MATTDKVVSFKTKMLVPRAKWDANFLQYLRNEIESVTAAVYFQSGVIEDATIDITSSTNDTFTLDISNASKVADGAGHVMDLSLVPSSEITNYPFENTNTDTYFVGIRYQSVADTVERNPRTRDPQYVLTEDTIGELGDPDSVTDNTTFIRLVVDTILETSVDHSGRPVKVYLKTPVSPTPSVAFFTGTVSFVGGVNVIDIPYTGAQGPLGQTAPTFPISLTATDYTVHVQGVSWFEGTDLRNDPVNYVFIGIITGNGPAATPTVFDMSDQNTVFLLSLDKAYRAGVTTDPAPGRRIQVDKQAVVLEQSATALYGDDEANAALWFDKSAETIQNGLGHLFLSRFGTRAGNRLVLKNAADSVSGGDVQFQEPVDLIVSTNQVSHTRGAFDPTTFGLDILESGDAFLLIQGSALGQDGFYKVQTAGATTFVVTMDGTTVPNFSAESGLNATWYVATEEHLDGDWQDSSYHGRDLLRWNFPIAGRGLTLRALDLPTSPTGSDNTTWLRFGRRDNADENWFLRAYFGRLRMQGGNTVINADRSEGVVTGWAQFQSDKIEVTDLDTIHRPQETANEWGFDYRGADFGKDVISDDAGYQAAATFRHPWTDYDGGNENIHASEAFTAFDGTKLTLTRGGADNSNLPGLTDTNWILAEVEFTTPQSGDGVYLVKDKPTTTRVTLTNFNGGSPVFTPGQTGTVRFYGGSLTGPLAVDFGTQTGFVQTIVSPTKDTGCLRLHHRSTSTVLQDFCMVATNGDGGVANTIFAIRGSGAYIRRLTTKGATAALGAADSIITSLLQADSVDVDNSASRFLTLPDSESNADVIERKSGSTWTITRVLNRFDGPSWSGIAAGPDANKPTWSADTAAPLTADLHRTNTGANTQAVYYKSINLPQGVTLTNIKVEVNPVIGDGTASAFGVAVRRKVWNATSGAYLLSTGGGFARAGGGSSTKQTVTMTADQNNVIDNTDTEYWAILEKSDTPSASDDLLYGITVTYTVANLGQSLFDVV
jgi:hypothetical protein